MQIKFRKRILLVIFTMSIFILAGSILVRSQTIRSLDIKANGSDGPITVPYNSDIVISWTTDSGICTASWQGAPLSYYSNEPISGSASFRVITTTTYTVTCSDVYPSDSVTVNVQPATIPVSVNLKANGSDGPITLPYYSDVAMSWISSYSDLSCNATIFSGWTGGEPSSGEIVIHNLTSSRVYTLSCSGHNTTVRDSVTINIEPDASPIKVDLKANGSDSPYMLPYDESLGRNGDLVLSWTSNDPDLKCQAGGATKGPWGGLKSASGEVTLNPTVLNISPSEFYIYSNNRIPGIYNISCTGRGETTSDFVEVRSAPPPARVYGADLKLNGGDGPYTVPYGENHMLSWTAVGYLDGRCVASGSWEGYKALSGQEFTGPLTSNKVYKITCDAQQGGHKQEDTVIIYVDEAAKLPPPVTTPTPTPSPTPTPTPTPTPNTTPAVSCDQTARSIVNAFGGCSTIDPTAYKNVYAACCTLITKESLLQILDAALADGVLDKAEKSSLLDALNTYLSK